MINDFTLPDDPQVKKEIEEYINQTYEFNDFIDFEELKDNEINLKCIKKSSGDPSKNWVPAYHFSICLNDIPIGSIDIRIGYNESLYYGGNIGYSIYEKYRGKGYTLRACKLLKEVAKAHKMKSINISNEYRNHASRRVCEKLGARLLRLVKLPEWNDMRKDGNEYENIFVWNIE